MALTNPVPMGPWKVSMWCTWLTLRLHKRGKQRQESPHASILYCFQWVLFLDWFFTHAFGVLQITVYDQEYFQGRRMEFTASCQNIMECGMENIRSLKVECGAYVSRDLPLAFLKIGADLRFCWCLTWLFLTLFSQLGGLWALQLLRPAVCPGEGRLPPLWGLQWQQLLPHWEDDLLQAHLLRCRFNTCSTTTV